MKRLILIPLLITLFPVNALSLDVPVQAAISNMTLEQKVGQLLMVGFRGTEPNEALRSLIQDMHVGGVILFSRNVESAEQLRSLTWSIQRMNPSHTPLLISVDEEGGRIVRLFRNFPAMPGNMAIGATRSPSLAYAAGRMTAANLGSLGINLNLAPVLDLKVKFTTDALRNRTFGETPDSVAKLGSAYIKGLQSLGVSATAKHFPGHGRTDVDSHLNLPVIKQSAETLKAIDMLPFREAIKSEVDVIMTAHVSYPALDRSGAPASLSKSIITNLLREDMRFNGVVITDDLEMKAITKKINIAEAAVRAINAGTDIILVSSNRRKQVSVYRGLLNAVRTGRISGERINESIKRIQKLKSSSANRVLYEKWQAKLTRYIERGWQSGLSNVIASRAVTLLQNKNQILPLKTKTKKTLVVSPIYKFYSEVRRRVDSAFFLEIPFYPKKSERKKLITYIKKQKIDQIVIGVINQRHADFVKEIRREINTPINVVSFDSPKYLSSFPSVDAFLCVYHYRKGSAEAAARALVGDMQINGSLPISVDNWGVGFGQRVTSDPFLASE